MAYEARSVSAAEDIRATVEHVAVGRELVADLLIEAEQIAVVDSGEEAVPAKLTHTPIVVAGTQAQRQTILRFQHDVSRVFSRTGRVHHVHRPVRIQVE